MPRLSDGRYVETLPTMKVRIKETGLVLLINVVDFDAKKHEAVTDEAEEEASTSGGVVEEEESVTAKKSKSSKKRKRIV
jgi:hypothetical protein